MWWSKRSATTLGTARLLTARRRGTCGRTWRTTAVRRCYVSTFQSSRLHFIDLTVIQLHPCNKILWDISYGGLLFHFQTYAVHLICPASLARSARHAADVRTVAAAHQSESTLRPLVCDPAPRRQAGHHFGRLYRIHGECLFSTNGLARISGHKIFFLLFSLNTWPQLWHLSCKARVKQSSCRFRNMFVVRRYRQLLNARSTNVLQTLMV